ncbi:MAG: PASTA domain-containing protein [Alloprevotella sp.]|nr:MAG: PASTA domain-containing protein [Alloprevotella sp.]
MTVKEFYQRITGRYLWGNLLAMLLTLVVVIVGVFVFLNFYTHHGETIAVPNLRGQRTEVAMRKLEALGMRGEVVDTGYNPRELADVILDQDLEPGYQVKVNRLIRLTVNAASPRPVTLPDIADNCSLREAKMRLEILGFRLTPIRRIRGDLDWVYAVEARGKEVRKGDKLNVNIPLTLVVGDGTEDEVFNGNDSLDRLYFSRDTTSTSTIQE